MFHDTVRGPWRGVREGTPSSKARANGFGSGSLNNLFAKIAQRDSILSEQRGKSNQKIEPLLSAAAESHEYGEK